MMTLPSHASTCTLLIIPRPLLYLLVKKQSLFFFLTSRVHIGSKFVQNKIRAPLTLQLIFYDREVTHIQVCTELLIPFYDRL